MLDFYRLAGQFQDFTAYRRAEDTRHAGRLARALAALADCDGVWEPLRDRAATADSRRAPLRALPLAAPAGRTAAAPRPEAVTVVATDGSQIYPDRHVEPTCYLLNVSRVAFHYGTTDPPLLAAEPAFHYRQPDLDQLDDPEAPRFDVSVEVVSALRDQLELEWLYKTAAAERRSARAIVALADGTLIRWMLRGMKNRALEDRMIARYLAELERFRADGLPVASYVSRPGSDEVVNLLRLHLGEPDFPEGEAAAGSLRGLLDRHLFEHHLRPGERSALFLSGSHILKEYGEDHHIGFFYVRLPGEVARVELPRWVADQPAWVDLIHAVVLDEAEKGGGYPVILAEAHERAVIRQQEKDVFYRILERQLLTAGAARATLSAKAASKRAPRI